MSKNLLVIALAIAFGLGSAFTANCTIPTIVSLTRNYADADHDVGDWPTVPHRTSTQPISCYIDVSTGSISFSPDISEDITSYEIWASDQSYCICSFSSQDEFIAALAIQTQPVNILFDTGAYTYVGVWIP